MEAKKVMNEIKIEGAKLIFKNFSGAEKEFNKAGDRNFGVILNDELAKKYAEEGWNIKYLKERPDRPGYRQPWLKVKIKFGKIPPICNLITSRGRTRLTEQTIGQLDYSWIINCDLVIRPYNYPASAIREAGTAAYLKAIYATIQEDDFAAKYADLPDAAAEPKDLASFD